MCISLVTKWNNNFSSCVHWTVFNVAFLQLYACRNVPCDASHTFKFPLLLLVLVAGRSHVNMYEPRGEHFASWIDLLSCCKNGCFDNAAASPLLLLSLVLEKSHLIKPTLTSCIYAHWPFGFNRWNVVLPLYNVIPPFFVGASSSSLVHCDEEDEDDDVSGSVYSSTASFDRKSSWMGRSCSDDEVDMVDWMLYDCKRGGAIDSVCMCCWGLIVRLLT